MKRRYQIRDHHFGLAIYEADFYVTPPGRGARRMTARH
jgi:hypothetical protein